MRRTLIADSNGAESARRSAFAQQSSTSAAGEKRNRLYSHAQCETQCETNSSSTVAYMRAAPQHHARCLVGTLCPVRLCVSELRLCCGSEQWSAVAPRRASLLSLSSLPSRVPVLCLHCRRRVWPVWPPLLRPGPASCFQCRLSVSRPAAAPGVSRLRLTQRGPLVLGDGGRLGVTCPCMPTRRVWRGVHFSGLTKARYSDRCPISHSPDVTTTRAVPAVRVVPSGTRRISRRLRGDSPPLDEGICGQGARAGRRLECKSVCVDSHRACLCTDRLRGG